jgi:hypothetical protein
LEIFCAHHKKENAARVSGVHVSTRAEVKLSSSP